VEAAPDWVGWHGAYDDRDSSLARRLRVVQGQLEAALDRQAPGEIRLIGLCAGQGRDVLPVVATHPRGPDVRARLVELDPHNTRLAADAAAGLDAIEIVTGDASLTESYAGAVPAHVVLACGVFGNIADDDVASTIEHLPELCAEGATVIWTRGATTSDLRTTMRRWFAGRGFEELFFEGEPEGYGVGVHRLIAEPKPFDPDRKLFTFVR
jgi:hypothetical protein